MLAGRKIKEITLQEFLVCYEASLRLGCVEFAVTDPATKESVVYRLYRDPMPTEHAYPKRTQ